MASHYKDPGIKYGRSREKGAVDADMAEKVIQKIVTQAKAAQRQGVPITQEDIARLIAFADLESGFNPDAANKDESPSGVFQIADKTARDVFERLKKYPSLIGGYQVKGTYGSYDRFDPDSNIAVGIAVYLDKKRKAGSDDVNRIYKYYNPEATPAEQKALRKLYEKYKNKKLSLEDSGSDTDKVAEAREPDSDRTTPDRQTDDTSKNELAGSSFEVETAYRGEDSGSKRTFNSMIAQAASDVHTDAAGLANDGQTGFLADPGSPLRHAMDALGLASDDVQLTPAVDYGNMKPDSFDMVDKGTSEMIGSCVITPDGCEMTAGDKKIVLYQLNDSDVSLESYAKNDEGDFEFLGQSRIGANDGITTRRPFMG
jgi:hypothetical protein